MDTKQIKQLAVDVNNVAEASFQSGKEHVERPLLAKIKRIEDELKKRTAYFNKQVEGHYDMANRAREQGVIEGLCKYAWWKDGVQYVGTCGTTLKEAIERR